MKKSEYLNMAKFALAALSLIFIVNNVVDSNMDKETAVNTVIFVIILFLMAMENINSRSSKDKLNESILDFLKNEKESK